MGSDWTVPVVELTRGEPKGTTMIISDGGRISATSEIESLLASGQRVLAVDPTAFGESDTGGTRTYTHALLLATLGERALGIEAGQVAAIAHWATDKFGAKPTVQTIGPRSGLGALVAAAMEPTHFGALNPSQQLGSLRDILLNNWTVNEKPELFCFGLFESFDVPQLKALSERAD